MDEEKNKVKNYFKEADRTVDLADKQYDPNHKARKELLEKIEEYNNEKMIHDSYVIGVILVGVPFFIWHVPALGNKLVMFCMIAAFIVLALTDLYFLKKVTDLRVEIASKIEFLNNSEDAMDYLTVSAMIKAREGRKAKEEDKNE